MRKIVLLILAMTILLHSALLASGTALTPYSQQVSTEEYVCGATFMLENTANYAQWLETELRQARDVYHLNTITVYGLEDYDDAYKTALFAQLKALGLKLCVRIEGYDSGSFAFTKEDAAAVMRRYERLVEFTCRAENRDAVLYYALNMPVDDPAVQKNLGGVNSQRSKSSQVTYAEEIVRLMRACTAQYGYPEAKLYLSVFYGWDASFDVPSYASAGADGYFINNYTYPVGRELPGADAAPDQILNSARLKATMDLFLEDYPGGAPLVVECGFHTLEYNHGQWPSQTAGLVQDRQTKAVALKAVVDYYEKNYPFVEGILYFGYNLFKEEGSPAAVMDWSLRYPAAGESEAESGSYPPEALTADPAASGGAAVKLGPGDSLSFSDCSMTQQLVVVYRAEAASSLELRSGGRLKREAALPAGQGYAPFGIPLILAQGSELEIVCTAGSVYVDKILLLEQLEAEYAESAGAARVVEDAAASQGAVVEGLIGRENALGFSGVRGGDTLEVTYSAEKETDFRIVLSGGAFSVKLPASKTLTTVSLSVSVERDGDLEIYAEGDSGLRLDCLKLSGTPGTAQTIPSSDTPSQTDAQTPEPQPSSGLPPAALAGITAAAALGTWAVIRKKKSK